MHINGVGGDCPGKTELHPDVLRLSSVFVEYEPQTRIEGDLQHLPADFAVTELWQVLAGQTPGRAHTQEITLFDSVGFALQDYSALRFMRDAASELGLGQLVSLIPELVNPKDLFVLLHPETQATPATDMNKTPLHTTLRPIVKELVLSA
jgi:ornithine cyclodeaminase